MFLSREDSESGASQEAWTGSVQGELANSKLWFDRLLTGMVEAGFGIPALCLYLTLSEPELLARVVALGLPTPHDRPIRRAGGRNPWTEAEIRQLIEWWGDGIRVSRIAEALGRSKSGIYAKKRRLGLPARDRKGLVDRDPVAGFDMCLGAGVEIARRERTSEPDRGAARETRGRSSPSEPSDASDLTGCAGQDVGSSAAVAQVAPTSGESICRGSAGRSKKRACEAGPEGVWAKPALPDGGELGSVRRGTASPALLTAIDEARRLARKVYGSRAPDWSRVDWSEEATYELALRGFAGQSRFGVARDMGISVQAAADRLTRLGMGSVRKDWGKRGWSRQVEGFDVATALDRMRTSGAAARVCLEFCVLFFVGRQDRTKLRKCPEWHREHGDGPGKSKQRKEKLKTLEWEVFEEIQIHPAHLDLVELKTWKQRCHEQYLAQLDEWTGRIDINDLSKVGSMLEHHNY